MQTISAGGARSVLMHCNAGRDYGMGHLMRVLTLGAEAAARGWSVTLAGDLDPTSLNIIRDQLGEVPKVHRIARPDHATRLPDLVKSLSPDVVHLDSYLTESDALAPTASFISNVQDGEFGSRPANLVIDPNYGAESNLIDSPMGAHPLFGISYAHIRSQALAVRGRWMLSPNPSRVLIVLGGTDPFRLTPTLLRAMSAMRRRLQITVVAPVSVHDDVERAAQSSPHAVQITGFLSDLPAAAVAHDLVISAAGTSVWDFACMGVPTAMVCVTENQEKGYDGAASRGLAVPLQRSPVSSWAHVADRVDDLLDDVDRLSALSRAGMSAVDGLGAWRVVSAWESLMESNPTPAASDGYRARPAVPDDARMLFDWRNDPETRRVSRSAEAVGWDDHVEWLARTFEDDERVLLIVEKDARPIGTVRWDHRGGPEWEVSITLAPQSRGRGLATGVLSAGEEGLLSENAIRFIAAIQDANEASRRLFARAGYLPFTLSDDRGFAEYAKLRAPSESG